MSGSSESEEASELRHRMLEAICEHPTAGIDIGEHPAWAGVTARSGASEPERQDPSRVPRCTMTVSMDTHGHHHSGAEHHYRINSAVAAPEHDAEACGRAERSKVAGTLKPCDMQGTCPPG